MSEYDPDPDIESASMSTPSNDDPAVPRGAIPRVEKQYAHREFLEAVRPPAALINIVHVRRLLKAGYTADSWFPEETTVLTTTTVADNKLARIGWQEELAFIKAFEPDYHLPTDYPVYGDMDPERRVLNTKRCAQGTLYMTERLADRRTEIIPLIKGTNPAERFICEATAEELEADIIAKYGTQYFTVPGSGQFPALRKDLEAIESEVAPEQDVLVIGAMSPSGKFGVQKFPDSVTATAGSRWYKRVKPRSATPEAMQREWSTLDSEISRALGVQPQYDPPAASVPDRASPRDGVGSSGD